jgi:hypothetical protein
MPAALNAFLRTSASEDTVFLLDEFLIRMTRRNRMSTNMSDPVRNRVSRSFTDLELWHVRHVV